MVNNLIELSKSNDSGFFLKEYDFIIEKMKSLWTDGLREKIK